MHIYMHMGIDRVNGHRSVGWKRCAWIQSYSGLVRRIWHFLKSSHSLKSTIIMCPKAGWPRTLWGWSPCLWHHSHVLPGCLGFSRAGDWLGVHLGFCGWWNGSLGSGFSILSQYPDVVPRCGHSIELCNTLPLCYAPGKVVQFQEFQIILIVLFSTNGICTLFKKSWLLWSTKRSNKSHKMTYEKHLC